MDFGILGPLEVRVDESLLPLRGAKQRALLAIFLLHPNEVVSSERLIDELWGDDPPETAANTLQVYVSQLRKALGRDVLVTHAPGYLLRAEPDQVDALRFERLVAEADGAEPDEGAVKLREALSLWRGSALADFAFDQFAQTEIARLEELRLAATEERIDADLALGRHAELVGELEALVLQHPLRERLRAQLMLALYRSGRQAEALQEYQRTRRELVEELGIDPSPALQRLEKQILVQDAALDLPAGPAGSPPPEAPPAEVTPSEPERRETRKTVTVLFSDLDAASREGGLDPEALVRVAERSIETAEGVLVRHGATVEQLAGERLMAVFGVPAVHEDDALRAVRAASELHAGLAELSAELERSSGVTVCARTGVATGQVLTGASLAQLTGEAVALASRLAQAAGADEILIGPATDRLVRSAVSAEPAGERAGPGARRLVSVRSDAPAVARRFDSPMVGRSLELAQLRHAFDRVVREQTCHLFTVLGPAGIGKSRLAAELRTALRGEATALAGRCLAYGDGITFWPIAEIVNQAAGDHEEAIAALLEGDEDAELIARRIAGAVGLAESASPAGTAETFWAVRKLLESLARRNPLVVFFDDLHWAEPTFLDLVEHLADLTRDAPVLLVCLARPELFEIRPAWAGGKLNATSILLEPLSGEECEVLIGNLLGASTLPPETRLRIADAADGNPLFVEQMLAMLSENGRTNGRHAIPPTIEALLAARLDRLETGERGVLERASVVGKEFWPGAVAELSDEDSRSELPDRLQTLVRKELIRPGRTVFFGESAFRFRHHLIRDVAYESLSKHARSELHERFAAWLERRAGERTREFEEILGYHLAEAYRYRAELGLVDESARELAERAARRLADAGLRANAKHDLPAAISLLERAAELMPPDDPARLELLPELGEALRGRGELGRSLEVLDEAVERASKAGLLAIEQHARLIRVRVDLARRIDLTTAEARAVVERALEVLERLHDDRRLGVAWYLHSWTSWVACRAAETEQALRRSLEHARRAGDIRSEGTSLHLYVGAALFGPSPVSEGIQRCEEILERRPDSRQAIAVAMRALAGLKAMAGAFDEAFDLIERDREILRDLGTRVAEGSATGLYADVLMLAGDLEGAERELRHGCAIFEEMGDPSSFSTLAANLAEALYRQRRLDEALAWNERAEEAAQADDLHTQIPWRGTRAKILAERGETATAEALAREAVELGLRTDFLNFLGDAHVSLGETLLLGGRAEDGREAIVAGLAVYEQKGNAVSAAAARERLAAVAAA